jgi:hypothetical protein
MTSDPGRSGQERNLALALSRLLSLYERVEEWDNVALPSVADIALATAAPVSAIDTFVSRSELISPSCSKRNAPRNSTKYPAAWHQERVLD